MQLRIAILYIVLYLRCRLNLASSCIEGMQRTQKINILHYFIVIRFLFKRQVLSSSEGNILEDETAIQVITEAKTLGTDIAEKQKLADITQKEIDAARANYKPCGEATAVLFFCIADLCNIDPMYQYSLPWFVNLFIASIQAAEKSDNVAKRLQLIDVRYYWQVTIVPSYAYS